MRINQRALGRATVLDLEGELDLFNTNQLKDALKQLVSSGDVRVIMNLEQVSYIDSTGIGVFLSMLKPLRDKGGDLKLAAPSAPVQKVFQLTRLNQFFDTHGDIEAAEKSFN
ncbi:MAG: STAS domain-containing protein [Spirochaetota bacterium]